MHSLDNAARIRRPLSGRTKSGLMLAGCALLGLGLWSFAVMLSKSTPTSQTVDQMTTGSISAPSRPGRPIEANVERSINDLRSQAAEPAIQDSSLAKHVPVINARAGNVSTCYDKIKSISEKLIDTQHAGVSMWVRGAPNDHLFASSVTLKYGSEQSAEWGQLVLAATPSAGGCDQLAVQVLPMRLSCDVVNRNLAKSAAAGGVWNGMHFFTDKLGVRFTTIPVNKSVCVLTAQYTFFDLPPVRTP